MKLIPEYMALQSYSNVKRLLDPGHDYIKTEENVRSYLHNLPDSQIKNLYEAIEFTPFPILLAHEYSKRFSTSGREKRKLSI